MPPAEKSGRKRPSLTYHQRQQAHLTAQSNRQAINADVGLVLEHVDREAKRLSLKHKRSVEWFRHQFFQRGRIVRQKRAVSVFNAASQIDGFLEGRKGEMVEEDKTRLQEIKQELQILGGVEHASKLPDEMQQFLKTKTALWREQKSTEPRFNNRAIVQDVRLTLECVSNELTALRARTSVETFLFAVKGQSDHKMEGFVAASDKANRYLLHGMKKNTSEILKEFESHVLEDGKGRKLNHNGRLAEVKSKIRAVIREGLITITGDPKATMQYDRYQNLIVVERGVELVNWPDDVPFTNASGIGSMYTLRRLLAALTIGDIDKRCHWVNLSKEECEKRRDAYYEAVANMPPRKRKRRASTSNASDSNSSHDEDGDEPPAKKTRKAELSGKENDASRIEGSEKDRSRTEDKENGACPGKTQATSGNTEGIAPLSVLNEN